MLTYIRVAKRTGIAVALSVCTLLSVVHAQEPLDVKPVIVEGTGLRAPAGVGTAVESSPLEDVLLEKNLITREDWVRIKAEEERRQFDRLTEKQFVSSPRWFERINVYGYTQFRYTTKSNQKLDIPQGESFSTNNSKDFFYRRIRMVFQGQMSERLAFFLQAAYEGDGFRLQNLEFVDAYADYYLTLNKEHRIRAGLHRVPNSFDTYRSSTNRQELD
nr:hypothetical protein [Nitrospira sp.]